MTANDDGTLHEKPIATPRNKYNKVNLPPSPTLTLAQRDELAAQFAAAIPDREFAMANLQGLLMNFKSNPSGVIPEVPRWVEKERIAKGEREKAKKEADEKSKKEANEKTKEAGGKDEKKEGLDDLLGTTNGITKSLDS